jgi:hypothetical protein
MPPIAVYRVNFANGNLTPELDLLGWGPMVQSAAVPGKVESHSEPGGLHLSYTRQFQDPTRGEPSAPSTSCDGPSTADSTFHTGLV